MSHAIDFEGIQEKLFLLRHLSLGAKSYCFEEEIASENDLGEGEFDSYWGWLKVILSNYVIEIAVKLRMIQEFCTKNGYGDELANLETIASEGPTLGNIIEGSFDLTIRETTNKIIHATTATIDFSETSSEEGLYKHWDGYYHLFGKKGSHKWHVALDINNWSKAVTTYIDELISNEYIIYIGHDWA